MLVHAGFQISAPKESAGTFTLGWPPALVQGERQVEKAGHQSLLSMSARAGPCVPSLQPPRGGWSFFLRFPTKTCCLFWLRPVIGLLLAFVNNWLPTSKTECRARVCSWLPDSNKVPFTRPFLVFTSTVLEQLHAAVWPSQRCAWAHQTFAGKNTKQFNQTNRPSKQGTIPFRVPQSDRTTSTLTHSILITLMMRSLGFCFTLFASYVIVVFLGSLRRGDFPRQVRPQPSVQRRSFGRSSDPCSCAP